MTEASDAATDLDAGLAHHEAGRFAEAERLYRRFLDQEPDHPDALNLLGVMLQDTGDLAGSIAILSRAVAADPAFPEAFANLARAQCAAGDPAAAKLSSQQAIELDPDLPEAHLQLARSLLALHDNAAALAAATRAVALAPESADAQHDFAMACMRLKDFAAAAAALRQAVRLKPNDAEYLAKLGRVLCELGDHTEALLHLRRAIELAPKDSRIHLALVVAFWRTQDVKATEAACSEALRLVPNSAELWVYSGYCQTALGRYADAAERYRTAIALDPNDPKAHSALGAALHALECLPEAEASYREALRLRPDDPHALNNLGNTLHDLGRWAEAEMNCREALRLRPDYPDAHNNLGNTLRELGRLAEAEMSCREALRLRPDLFEAHNNLGTTLQHLGHVTEAEASFRAALRLRPDRAGAHINLAYALLLTGQFEEGWNEYEWRWKTSDMSRGVRNFSAPLWQGEPIGDRVILLHAEQGFGDTLQFCRYAPLIPTGAKVVLEVQAPLVRLLSRLDNITQIVARGDRLPAFDMHCPLLSLPRAFGTTLDTIPDTTPYLTADPTRAVAWCERLAGLAGLRVGLVWAGGQKSRPNHAAIDRRRSILLDAMAPLGEVSGVTFISLQKGEPAAQAANPPRGIALHDFTADLHDFTDTAALVDALDLVISVDTAVAHLAGALGKPVWLLNRFDTEWRWLLNRDDSPWYPRLRQFRQPAPGDWDSAIREVRDALTRLAAGDRDQLRPRSAMMHDLSPEAADAQLSLGHAHTRLKNYPAAAAAYRAADRLAPDRLETLLALAAVLAELQQFDDAVDCCRRAVAVQPSDVRGYVALGNALRGAGDVRASAAALLQAVRLNPDDAEALAKLGQIICELGDHIEALLHLREAIALVPEDSRIHLVLVVALWGTQGVETTGMACTEALRLAPSAAEFWADRGSCQAGLGRFADAAECYRKAIALNPDAPAARNNLGNALRQLGRLAEAETNFRQALRRRPDFFEAYANLGAVLQNLGRVTEAEASYRTALRLRPDSAGTHSNLARVLLLTGRFKEGWNEYEWRWNARQMSGGQRNFSPPLWHGEALGNRIILLHSEQGLGDTLQFCRYAPLIASGAKVVLEVQAPLLRLLSRLPGITEIIARGDRLPRFDVHCPLLSLPRAFGTTLDTIPGTTPYLTADPAFAEAWRERLAGLAGLRVGLVWAGGPLTDPEIAAVDGRRSIALDALAPLGEASGVNFISLQKGDPAAQAATPPDGMALHDFTADLHDFADTAALVDGLDLVISVDTAVAHLAGALGKPVWLLNRFDPCWRWLLNRDDSPWYPRLRQFRQPAPGDWSSVIVEVRDALKRLAAGDRDQLRPVDST